MAAVAAVTSAIGVARGIAATEDAIERGRALHAAAIQQQREHWEAAARHAAAQYTERAAFDRANARAQLRLARELAAREGQRDEWEARIDSVQSQLVVTTLFFVGLAFEIISGTLVDATVLDQRLAEPVSAASSGAVISQSVSWPSTPVAARVQWPWWCAALPTAAAADATTSVTLPSDAGSAAYSPAGMSGNVTLPLNSFQNTFHFLQIALPSLADVVLATPTAATSAFWCLYHTCLLVSTCASLVGVGVLFTRYRRISAFNMAASAKRRRRTVHQCGHVHADFSDYYACRCAHLEGVSGRMILTALFAGVGALLMVAVDKWATHAPYDTAAAVIFCVVLGGTMCALVVAGRYEGRGELVIRGVNKRTGRGRGSGPRSQPAASRPAHTANIAVPTPASFLVRVRAFLFSLLFKLARAFGLTDETSSAEMERFGDGGHAAPSDDDDVGDDGLSEESDEHGVGQGHHTQIS